ncbi:hypothetical protein ACHHYP_07673, partial [Achlya hypogyna]
MVWFLDVLGALYIVGSCTLSALALVLFSPYMENCMYWPKFEAHDTFSLLTAVLNAQLPLLPGNKLVSLDLLAPSAGIVGLAASFGVNPAYPRLVVYQELNTLPVAIAGLRHLDTPFVNYMLTSYCWVDLDRRWALAHTSKRLERCRQQDADNGAVYLEAVLRNIDMGSWLNQNEDKFMGLIANAVVASGVDGASWVRAIMVHEILSIADELAHWMVNGLTRFQLQFGNRVQIGIDEQITVQNAFGGTTVFSIKSIPAVDRGASWTSATMMHGLANDFTAINGNQSLVMNSSQWFGAIDPTQIEANAVGLPLGQMHQLIHDRIGALGDIDLRWIAPPLDLITTVSAFNDAVFTQLDADNNFYSAFMALPSISVTIAPLQWLDPALLYTSGNPMCGHGTPLPFVQRAFGFDDACGTEAPFAITVMPFNGLFSMLMLNGTTTNVCAQLPSQTEVCVLMLAKLARAMSALSPPMIPRPDLVSLNLSKMQFVLNRSELSIQLISVLDDDYAFFGWIHMYDWAMNMREVVSFEGDRQTLNLVSYANPPMSSVGTSLESSLGAYLWYVSGLVTLVLAVLAVVILGFYICSRPSTVRWWHFNRIVSAVWLNRSILLARSLTATLCLATAPIEPSITRTSVARLAHVSRSPVASLMLANEATWFAYVVHDFMHPVMSGRTSFYAPPSAWLATAVIATVDILAPVQMTVDMHRICSMKNMDWQVYCNSATIAIGSPTRMGFVFSFQCAATLVCFALAIALVPVPPRISSPSALLHASVFIFDRPQQKTTEGVDRVTAAMGGLFYFSFRGVPYVFNVNLWRFIAADAVGAYRVPLSTNRRVLVEGSTSKPLAPATVRHRWYLRASLRHLLLALGFTYLVCTLTSNILYYSVVANDLSNDYGWAGFNSTGAMAFLANAFNRQLLVATSVPDFALDSPANGDLSQLYNGTTTTIVWAESSARRQLFTPRPLADIVRDLRAMNPCMLPWMFTQYCWLDLNRTWAMAATERRQERCATMTANGAVHLESALRNVNNWTVWDSCWGTSFEIGFGTYLRSSDSGQRWLTSLQSPALSVADEVAYWATFNITSFVLQWQNYKTPGMIDTISIQSALGWQYPLQLSNSLGAYHTKQHTSLKMYWSLASDLWAIATNSTVLGGSSLL